MEQSKTSEFVEKVTKLQYMLGLPYVWVDDKKPKYFQHFNKIFTFVAISFVISDYVSFFTQNHLTEKQTTDRTLFTLSHTILLLYCFVFEYYKEDIKILYKVAVSLKTHHNDLAIEKKMIRKAKIYLASFGSILGYALTSYAIDGTMQVLKANGTFTPVITAWPGVTERGFWPDVFRIIAYFGLWMFMLKVYAVHVFVFSIAVILSHQYTNLQSYFYSLDDIFKKTCSVEEKIKEYEKSLKLGLWMHAETLWCVEECQRINTWVFNGQTTFSFTIICLELLQMANSTSVMNALSNVSSGLAVLLSNGFFMCNAGDITAEAASLPSAIFASGWHHCSGSSSARIRKLITLALAQSQKPVVIRSFYVIEFSYETFVSLLKASYSLFSILY
ncbi:uncharacterized protein LOC123720246 [Pieris brassicae]|uniref:uncharacterized protein LOC123720246 n=1 Tax=Pieris brassicae TaxID=7116 RepID=UPI001E65EAAE|nr:uncharacterized protein LOC123720246 [Pieris brassicae]